MMRAAPERRGCIARQNADGCVEELGIAAGRDMRGQARERADFIRANTRARPVPLCPEVTLRVADEAFELWFRTEEELAETGLPPPFWAFAWAGGQALARHVLDHPALVAGRHVLDLGAGSGLVAIAAVLAGAAEATAADLDPWAVVACQLNAADNGVNLHVTGADLLDGPPPRADAVLVGDLYYDRAVAARLSGYLARASEAGAEVLIGDPGRTYLPRTGLVRLAEYGVPTTRALEDAEIKRTAVWRFATASACGSLGSLVRPGRLP